MSAAACGSTQAVSFMHPPGGRLLQLQLASCSAVTGSEEDLLQLVCFRAVFPSKWHGHAGEQRKGKYAPLQALIPRLGARRMLQLHPQLLPETLQAMRVPAICPSASAVLDTLLRQLYSDCLHADGALCWLLLHTPLLVHCRLRWPCSS